MTAHDLTHDELDGDLEDYRRDAAEKRARKRGQQCRCGSDMPGRCSGADFCPLCADDEDDDQAGDE